MALIEEVKKTKDLLCNLGFDGSNVDPKVLKGFQYTEAPVEWMKINRYSLTADVIKQIGSEDKISVSPFEFISELSRLGKITGVRVCLFQFNELGWVSLVATEGVQRTIVSVFSGDGWADVCQFGVKPKSAQ